MGFLVLAKHGLNSKVGFKTKFSLQTREKRVEEEEEGEEEEEEEEEEEGGAEKGMETNLDYGFYEFWYGSLDFLYGTLWNSKVLYG